MAEHQTVVFSFRLPLQAVLLAGAPGSVTDETGTGSALADSWQGKLSVVIAHACGPAAWERLQTHGRDPAPSADRAELPPPRRFARVAGLIKASHPGPSVAVTLLASAYGVSTGLARPRVALIAATVLAGQLSIGWANDLIDADRDRATGRHDKPLASGELSDRSGRAACAVAAAGTVALSLRCGAGFSAIYLPCVGAGWSYNLGLKATVLSWLPYAAAFGGLPVFVARAGGAVLPPWWVPTAAALLGVGAHLMNVLPDLADDEATGIRGLAHRLGPRRTTLLGVASLVTASALLLIGARPTSTLTAIIAGAVAGLAGLAVVGDGKLPFYAAIGIAAADVALLLGAR